MNAMRAGVHVGVPPAAPGCGRLPGRGRGDVPPRAGRRAVASLAMSMWQNVNLKCRDLDNSKHTAFISQLAAGSSRASCFKSSASNLSLLLRAAWVNHNKAVLSKQAELFTAVQHADYDRDDAFSTAHEWS